MLLFERYRPDIKAPLTKINASSDDPKATSFCTAYEILTLQMKFQSDLGQMRFQLIEFDKETLVSIPMNAENNRCVYISVDGQAEYVVVIDKILSVVGQVLMMFKKIHCCKHCRIAFVFDSDIEDHDRMHGH